MDLPFSLDFSYLISFLSALVVVVSVGWLAVRGRSFFPINYRLWRLVHRKDDVSTEWLDGPVRERVELMKCRALIMWVDSYPQARRVQVWATERGIDLGTLGECGTYFDRVTLSLCADLPRQSTFRRVAMLGAYAACILIMFGVIFVSRDEAMLSLHANGHWLSVSKVAAHPLSSPHYLAMTLADCAKDKGYDPAGFGDDRPIVCGILRDPHLPAAVDEGVRDEHVAGGALCGLGVFILLLLNRRAVALRSAHAVSDQLELYADQVQESTPHTSSLV